MPRSYEMANRAAAMERTRQQILAAALESFRDRWYDEVTVADIARAAGVSTQTVVNHFGNKVGVYLAGVSEFVAPRISAARGRARVGDVATVVAAAVDDYEESGDGTVRTVALSLRLPELEPVVEGGARAHRRWVEEMFAPQLAGVRGAARERLVDLLAVALDVHTWHGLRRRAGRSPAQVKRELRQLVSSILAANGASLR